MRVALVAQFDGVDSHTDGPPMLAALQARGLEAEVVPWGRRDEDWSSWDGVVVRNAWDYVDRREEFLAWAASVAAVTRFANPVPMLEWNSDKRYLRDLEVAGVPIVPTVWVGPRERLPRWRWEELVVKPAVSAGSRGAARHDGSDRDGVAAHVEAIHAVGDTAMLQPFLSDVDRVGEFGTYVFGGRVSHAITKSAVLRPGAPPPADFSLAHGQVGRRTELTAELIGFATDVLARLPASVGSPLYARVDALRGGDGRLVLLELEVFEPFLFLETDPEAAVRFARAVDTWLRSRL
jgi:glutathione synthase/RimK-type ligase-like ATP-grasp enzyme